MQRKKYRIDHVSKTKNHQKNHLCKKIVVRSIRIYPENLATFEENLIFCASFWTFWTRRLWNPFHKFELLSVNGSIWAVQLWHNVYVRSIVLVSIKWMSIVVHNRIDKLLNHLYKSLNNINKLLFVINPSLSFLRTFRKSLGNTFFFNFSNLMSLVENSYRIVVKILSFSTYVKTKYI